MDVRAVKRKLVRTPKDWNKFPDMRVGFALVFEGYNLDEDLSADAEPERREFAAAILKQLEDEPWSVEGAIVEQLDKDLQLASHPVPYGRKLWSITHMSSDDTVMYYEINGPDSVEDLRWLEEKILAAAYNNDPVEIDAWPYHVIREFDVFPCGYPGPRYCLDDSCSRSDGTWEEFYDLAEFDPKYKEKCAR